MKALQETGVPVFHFHAESSHCQFEIATEPSAPLLAVDRLVQAQHIIRSRAMDYGYRATFTPRPLPSMCPSGLHIHLSIEDRPEHEDSGIKRRAEAFLAGIIHHLPALVAIGMPSEPSYDRIVSEDAGEWVAWGTQNRLCPVRRITTKHFEFRAIDCCANPFWVLAAYIASGLQGIQNKMPLLLGDCRGIPSCLDPSQLQELNIKTRMPRSIAEALGICRAHRKLLGAAVGHEILDYYIMAKTGELATLAAMSPSDRVRFHLERC